MKKLALLVLGCLSTLAIASETGDTKEPREGEVSKVGVLITQECMEKTLFKECPSDSPLRSPYVLYVHGDFMAYTLDISDIAKHELDEGFARNKVTIIGKLEGSTIKARAYKAPPPEGKSFFKGCL